MRLFEWGIFLVQAEDRVNVMSKERRIEGLQKVHALIYDDIQKEVKTREGILHLVQVYRDTPNFSTEDGQADVAEKLQQCESMLRFLHACNHKVLVALADIEGVEKPRHPLQRFMERDRDKNSLPMTVLRIPEYVSSMARDQSIVWLIYWLIDQSLDWLIDWLIDWLMDGWMDGWMDWLIDCTIY